MNSRNILKVTRKYKKPAFQESTKLYHLSFLKYLGQHLVPSREISKGYVRIL